MKKMNFVSVLALLLLFSPGVCRAADVGAGSGRDKPDSPPPRVGADKKGTAYFDYFKYQGLDDSYNRNPLTNESSFYTAILPGWYSDPSICTNGKGDYFLVTSTFCYFPGVPIFHSRDMVNWRQIGHVLNRESQVVLANRSINDGGLYAASIAYNRTDQTFYVVTTSVGKGNFYVTTKDPFAGNWSEPVWLPSQIKGIDPSFFFDEDGTAYLLHNYNVNRDYSGHCQIRIHRYDLSHNTTENETVLVDKGVHPQDNPIWIEGPHMYKIGGHYYLMAAEGGTGTYHSEVVFRGDSPLGPFTAWSDNPMLTQRQHLGEDRVDQITCTGHADIIRDDDGQWWGVFLGCRPLKRGASLYENLGRETFLMPVKWSEDGFPYFTQGNDVIGPVQSKSGVKRKKEVTFGNFSVDSDFRSKSLGDEWISLRSPATSLYSLSEKPGFCALKCTRVKASDRATPAFLCRRMQHHRFDTETALRLSAIDSKDFAGLLLFKNETNHLFMAVNKTDKHHFRLSLIQVDKTGEKILSEKTLSANTENIKLKVSSFGTHYDFYYTTGSSAWNLLANKVDAYVLSTDAAGGFTGTTIGMYAVRME